MATVNHAKQQMIDGLKVPDVISIVGTGLFGSWVAILAAIAGARMFVLIDPGELKETDIATLPLSPHDVGKPKVDVLSELITRLRPEVTIEAMHEPFTFESHSDTLKGVIVNGAENSEIERGLARLAKGRGQRYFTGAYNGLFVGAFDFSPPALNLTSEPRPAWVGSAVLVASITLHSMSTEPVNFAGQAADLNMSKAVIGRRLKVVDSPGL